MTALRRIRAKAFGAALAVLVGLSAPAVAQSSDQPVDVSSGPAPTADTVGPAQLRDFSLGGQATRPAPTNPVPVQAAPVATQPRAETRLTPPAQERLPARQAPGAAPTASRVNEPQSEPSASASLPAPRTLPLDVVTPDNAPAAAVAGSEAVASEAAPVTLAEQGVSPWPWLAALLAALGASALWWWSRRNRSRRLADPVRMAFAGGAAEAESPPVPRAIAPLPPAQPKSPAAAPAGATAKPKLDGLITSSALKPVLELRFVPDRVVITDSEAIVQFDLILANVGSAAARNVLVEGLLVCASPIQDQEIAQFFEYPRGTGDRIPGIAAMDSLALKSAVRLPLDKVKSFKAGGRTLFVPLVAFNILYGASDQQVSASYLVGRGKQGDEKLAPFRLDLGPRIFRGLSTRPHSGGLSARPLPAGAVA